MRDGRESPRIPDDQCWSRRRLGDANFRTHRCTLQNGRHPVGAVSFVDEGTGKVLDVLQERACVNTLCLAVFTYGRGIAGRQIPPSGGVVRNMVATPDRRLYLACSGVNKVAVVSK